MELIKNVLQTGRPVKAKVLTSIKSWANWVKKGGIDCESEDDLKEVETSRSNHLRLAGEEVCKDSGVYVNKVSG